MATCVYIRNFVRSYRVVKIVVASLLQYSPPQCDRDWIVLAGSFPSRTYDLDPLTRVLR